MGAMDQFFLDFLQKPEPGMILKAANDLNIAISKSVMVGDKESDRIKLPQLKSYVIRSRYVNRWDFEDLIDPFCRHDLPHY